jgi:hypothetical protein
MCNSAILQLSTMKPYVVNHNSWIVQELGGAVMQRIIHFMPLRQKFPTWTLIHFNYHQQQVDWGFRACGIYSGGSCIKKDFHPVYCFCVIYFICTRCIPWLPCWGHCPWCGVKNTFRILVYFREYTFPILLIFLQTRHFVSSYMPGLLVCS